MIKIDEQWIVVAYVTCDTPYEFELAQHLLPSLDKFKIPHYIEVVNNEHSWIKNVAQKPKVIYNAMEKYPSKNIVYIDCDAEILENPVLFNNIPEEYDIAIHTLNWNSWYQNESNIKEMLSGTLFLRNNLKVKELVLSWYNQATNTYVWEQKVLEKLLKDNKDIKVYDLPLNYCYISSLPDGKEPHVKLEHPIILHTQASRKYKKLIR